MSQHMFLHRSAAMGNTCITCICLGACVNEGDMTDFELDMNENVSGMVRLVEYDRMQIFYVLIESHT